MEYRLDAENAGAAALNIPARHDYITAKTDFAVSVPFEYLRETYKAQNALTAIVWGLKKTKMFVHQTILTVKRLVTGDLGRRAISGPVAIATITYKIASTQSLTYYMYFLGLISSVIAVMNLLPLPIVDGGVIVLLIIENIKGSPISQRAQEIISYIGLVFIIALFLLLVYNDVSNLWFYR